MVKDIGAAEVSTLYMVKYKAQTQSRKIVEKNEFYVPFVCNDSKLIEMSKPWGLIIINIIVGTPDD